MTTLDDLPPWFPLLFALPALPGQQGPQGEANAQQRDGAPKTLGEAWTEALRQMRACKAPGLVFVLPPADAKPDPAAVAAALAQAKAAYPLKGGNHDFTPKTARDLFLLQLQLLRASNWNRLPLDGASAKAQMDLELLFLVTVPVLAEAAACGAKPGETVLLVEPEGSKRRGFTVGLGDATELLAHVGPFVTAPEALAPRRAQVPPAIKKAIEELRAIERAPQTSDAQAKAARELTASLQRQLPAAAPALLVEELRVVQGPANALETVKLLQPDPLLHRLAVDRTPLGAVVGASWDPCPPCGMAAVPLPMRSTLRLLAQ